MSKIRKTTDPYKSWYLKRTGYPSESQMGGLFILIMIAAGSVMCSMTHDPVSTVIFVMAMIILVVLVNILVDRRRKKLEQQAIEAALHEDDQKSYY